MKTISLLFALLISIHVQATEPLKAYEMVTKGNALIVDVREVDEVQYGMIDKAIWFPKSQLMTNKKLMTDFKEMAENKKIFLYCKGGKRAELCKQFLKQEGVESENLGGFDELKKVLPTKSLLEMVNRIQECKS